VDYITKLPVIKFESKNKREGIEEDETPSTTNLVTIQEKQNKVVTFSEPDLQEE
jgi:hypothetical protein